MLRVSRSTFGREIQVRVFHSNKPWIELSSVQSVRDKKTFAFEPNMRFVLKTLRKLLTCTENKAYSIYDRFPSIRSIDMMDNVGKNIEILMENGVTSTTIIDNPFLIVMTKDELQTKLDILRKLKMSKNMINDLVPLLEMKKDRLRQVSDLMSQEQHRVPGGNRISYFSDKLNENIEFLRSNGVSLDAITTNSVVLTMDQEQLQQRLRLLLDFEPRHIDDIFPLICVEKAELVKFKQILDEQELSIENPIYYFSERLKVPPPTVSTHFAKNPAIFFRSPQSLRPKLEMLLEFEVDIDSILNAPLTFRMSLNSLEKRIKELESGSIKPVYSWMLTCTTSQLNTIIEKQSQQKEALDGCDTAIEYISKRLNWNDETKDYALKSYPSIAKCNVTKAKHLLDYLLTETHFTESDITSYPRVFMNSFETLNRRLDELPTVGYIPKRLYIICLDRKRYLEVIEKHCKRLNYEHIWYNFKIIEKQIKEQR